MTLAEIVALCGALAGPILATNAGAMTVIAVVILWLQRRALPEQRWAVFFGLAYCLISFRYILHFLQIFLKEESGLFSRNHIGTLIATSHLSAGLGVAIDLFFILTAAELLNIPRRYYKWIIHAVIAVFIYNVLTATVFVGGLWQRMPAAALSFVSLSLLGWAMYTNLATRRRESIAVATLVLCLFYGALHVLSAFFPFIAEKRVFYFNHEVEKHADVLGAIFRAEITPLASYDATTSALALILKLLIFASSLVLLFRSFAIFNPGSLRAVLQETTQGRSEYLSSGGFLRFIGETVGADLVTVCVILPEKQKGRVVWWRWITDEMDAQETPPSIEITEFPDPHKSIVGRVLETGSTIQSTDISRRASTDGYLIQLPQMLSFVTVPVAYHGSIIGCINVEWTYRGAFSKTTVLQIQNLADLLAANCQSYRELAALDAFARRLAGSETHTSTPPPPQERMLRFLLDTAHDVLSPLATGIALDAGFRRDWLIFHAGEYSSARDAEDSDTENATKGMLLNLRSLRHDGSMRYVIRKARLERPPLRLGELALALDRKDSNQQKTTPSLGDNFLHRRVVSSLLSHAALTFIQNQLWSNLSELQIELNSREVASTERWFKAIQRSVRKAGMLWIVAGVPGDRQLLGPPKALDTVKTLEGDEEFSADDTIRMFEMKLPTEPIVLFLNLPITGSRLWLAIRSRKFGEELTFASPWKVYLERLAEAADAALLRITATREVERLNLEAARSQGLTTAVVTTGTLVHQLGNFSRDFSSGIEALQEAADLGSLTASEQTLSLIHHLKQSTDEMSGLLRPLMGRTALDEHRPCDLLEAIRVSEQLYEVSLLQRDITLSYSQRELGKETLLVDVPFSIIVLAISNLVSNAIYAIDANGEIKIETKELVDSVECEVRDNGPGITHEIAGRLFELGTTSKPKSGGWGLYLTRRSLVENGGTIHLTSSQSGETSFTIKLPKPVRKGTYE